MAAPNIPSQTLPSNVADLDSWLLGAGRYVWVMKMEPTDLASGTATLYASTSTYRAQDSPPRLLLPSVAISILNERFGVGSEGGRLSYEQFKAGQLSYGGFELLNQDGQLDSWVTSYGWGDADCTLLFGEDGGTLHEFLTFKVVGEPEFDNDKIRFRVKGASVNPNGQIVTDTFTGDGYPSGDPLEGGDEHKGKTKPALVGKVDNLAPIFIDPANNTHLIDADGVDAIGEVYEGGYSGVAYTATIANGEFDTDAQPIQKITCDATGKARQGVGDYSLAANFKTLADDFGGGTVPVTAGLSEEGGFYIPAGANAQFAKYLHYAIQPLGIYWTQQDGAKLLAGEIGDPDDGTSVKTLTDAHIANIERRQTSPPAWQVRVGYRPLGTTLGNFVGAVDEDEISRLSQPTRFEVSEDATVLDDYLNAIALDALSSLYSQSDASTLAAELLAILKIKRDIYRVELVRHPFCAWIGQVVTLEYPRYGLSGGKKVMVTGWDVDLNNKRFYLEAWG